MPAEGLEPPANDLECLAFERHNIRLRLGEGIPPVVVKKSAHGRTRTCGLEVVVTSARLEPAALKFVVPSAGLEPAANCLDLVYRCCKTSWDYATQCHRSRALAANAGRCAWCLARSRTPGGL